MSRRFICHVFAVLVITGLTSEASAQLGPPQIQRPFDRPAVSPYMNLFRGGSGASTVLNYYGLVRPQQQALQTRQQFSRELRGLERNFNTRQSMQEDGQRFPRNRLTGRTGHPTSFMSIGGSRGGSQTGGGSGGIGSSVGGYSGHSAGFGYSGGIGSR